MRLPGVDALILSLGQVCVEALIALGEMKSAILYLTLWRVGRYSLVSVLLVTFAISGVLVEPMLIEVRENQ